MPTNSVTTAQVCPSARFQPWVGERYHTTGWNGLRLFIVGDSFWENEGDNLDQNRNLTSDVVRWAIERPCKDFMSYNHVERGIMGYDLDTHEQRDEFWQRVAFCNFFQRMMRSSNERPTRQDRLDAKPVFLDILDILRPHAVPVTSTRVWSALGKLSGVTSTLYMTDPPSEVRKWSRAEHAPVLATWTYHPSYWGIKAEQRFTGHAAHDRITRFLTVCREQLASGEAAGL